MCQAGAGRGVHVRIDLWAARPIPAVDGRVYGHPIVLLRLDRIEE
jgi:hypothetical protein